MRFWHFLFLPMLLLLAACDDRSPPGTYVLRYASTNAANHPFSRADAIWIRHVEAQSGGRLKIQPFWSGSLISASQSLIELRHGVTDIALITPIYVRGGAHALRTQAGFYGGVRDINDQVAVYKCLASLFPVFGEELRGMHVLAVQGGNFPGVLSRSKPIRQLADLHGMRLRGQTEAIEPLRRLNADPVNMPMGEVYSALAKGVIDGVVAPADTVVTLHFGELANAFTDLHFSRGAYPARAISDKAWNRLPDDLRRILTEAEPVWEEALNTEILRGEDKGIAYIREHHMEFDHLAPEEQKRFDDIYRQTALASADELSRFGIEGRPILATAQAVIRRRAEEDRLECPSVPETQP